MFLLERVTHFGGEVPGVISPKFKHSLAAFARRFDNVLHQVVEVVLCVVQKVTVIAHCERLDDEVCRLFRADCLTRSN
jgi:hypothetical protein